MNAAGTRSFRAGGYGTVDTFYRRGRLRTGLRPRGCRYDKFGFIGRSYRQNSQSIISLFALNSLITEMRDKCYSERWPSLGHLAVGASGCALGALGKARMTSRYYPGFCAQSSMLD
ncbi:hypothetical protein M408DRAFT_244344 [Serendipita vermifera MAFF 305830]|uniref:Uncharacterized protein n=1 Tax=Serendipita vermifera MAFF 305830 TaxID=933852 RepID=A0A0C2X484_SERVB|nr:hypothetical protein M408DRAFT_244344 [Serendipita vermifera MAFF 305830]